MYRRIPKNSKSEIIDEYSFPKRKNYSSNRYNNFILRDVRKNEMFVNGTEEEREKEMEERQEAKKGRGEKLIRDGNKNEKKKKKGGTNC